MSGLGSQSQESTGLDEYATAESSQAPTYAGYAPPPFEQQYTSSQSGRPHALSSSHQMPFLGPLISPRDPRYLESSDSLSVARSRTPPRPLTRLEIITKGPYYGRVGENLRIDFRSQIDYTSQDYHFFLSFGPNQCRADCIKSWNRDIWFYYTLSVTVPHVASTSAPYAMPLLLDVRGQNGDFMDLQNLDSFTYLDNTDFPQLTLPQAGKKRKQLDDTPTFMQPMAKRTVSQPVHRMGVASMAPSVQAPLAVTSPFSAPPPLFALPSGQDRSGSQPRNYDFSVPPSPSYASYGPSPVIVPQKLRSPTTVPMGTYGTLGRAHPSPRMARAQRAVSAAVVRSPPAQPSNPQLVRTSVLEQVQSSGARGFNPYAQYPTGKASLRIDGDLMAMTKDWSTEELEAKRRLVEFTRIQSGSQVATSFKAVTPEERAPNSACISCIYWEEQKHFFVTSVDTIALLESLIAARFTVEEKNRIRRNLEGFKPMTVSKLKDDTDSFFRLIMGFPNPKPRNIEKDVKVFPWSRLEEALSKIFGKYSASSASTASHIFHPVVTSSVGSLDQHASASPQASARPLGSSPQVYGMTSTSTSPPITVMPRQASRGMMHQVGANPSFLSSLPMTVREAQEYPGQASSTAQLTASIPATLGWQPSYLQAPRYPMGMQTGRAPAWDPLQYLGQSAAPSSTLYTQPLSYYPTEDTIESGHAKGPEAAYHHHSQPTTSA